MLADIIIVAIVGIVFILCIRKQITDHKKGIPSCGLNCGHCGGSCSSCSSSCQASKASEKTKSTEK